MFDREALKQFLQQFLALLLAELFKRFGPQQPPSPGPPGPSPPPVPPLPPVPPIPPPIQPPPQPAAAIIRLSWSGVGCTGTIIGPRRDDGRYWILTAAHCVKAIGQAGQGFLLDGRVISTVVVNLDRQADCAWLVTGSNDNLYPFAELAETTPPVGTKVWHAGYGVHNPGNREAGVVAAPPNSDGQIEFRLSVSSGDSGGGILIDADGEVVSCVCCTTNRGGPGRVWGTSPQRARAIQTQRMRLDEWEPLEIPIKERPDDPVILHGEQELEKELTDRAP
jgi:Trypsin-like peptidase domain